MSGLERLRNRSPVASTRSVGDQTTRSPAVCATPGAQTSTVCPPRSNSRRPPLIGSGRRIAQASNCARSAALLAPCATPRLTAARLSASARRVWGEDRRVKEASSMQDTPSAWSGWPCVSTTVRSGRCAMARAPARKRRAMSGVKPGSTASASRAPIKSAPLADRSSRATKAQTRSLTRSKPAGAGGAASAGPPSIPHASASRAHARCRRLRAEAAVDRVSFMLLQGLVRGLARVLVTGLRRPGRTPPSARASARRAR